MENKMADKTVTTCATMLVTLFQKRRQRQQTNMQCQRCSCLCHTYVNKSNNLSELNEMNDNKFFNCKCNHECQNKLTQCSKCGTKSRKCKSKKTKKKIVKFQIEHTGSMSSLASPYKPASNPTCSRDKLRNTISLCKLMNGKPQHEVSDSPLHNIHGRFCRLNNFGVGCGMFGSPLSLRSDTQTAERKPLASKHQTTSRMVSNQDDQRPKSFYEWAIPYENIEIGELVAASPKGPVHRGRWHGDVMIYTRSHATQEEIEEFHNEVSLLGLIRHENVVLFMGACIEPPHLAVVTSVRKGYTLYYHLHTRQTAFHFGSRFSIAKQIAQGMGYLHAKGITLGKLCSRNIFLESKVKIGITDYTMVNTPRVKNDYGCVPKGHLPYLSPELMRTLKKTGLYMTPTERASQKSDVFAYGTLLYEIFLGRYPFKEFQAEVIIWMVSNGQVQSLDETEFPLTFKGLIKSCWEQSINKRPDFHDILSSMMKLNIPRSLQKKLSLSDSGAINKQHNMHTVFTRLNSSPAQTVRWRKP